MTDVGTLLDKALGAYLGLAIGDALGASVEFMTPREIAHRFAAQGGVHRHIIGSGWLKLQPGQVTDDTTMSLALGDALLRGERTGRPFDTQLIAEAYLGASDGHCWSITTDAGQAAGFFIAERS